MLLPKQSADRLLPTLNQPSEICRANIPPYDHVKLGYVAPGVVQNALAGFDFKSIRHQNLLNELNECFELFAVRHRAITVRCVCQGTV
jgi:hypothetical protein